MLNLIRVRPSYTQPRCWYLRNNSLIEELSTRNLGGNRALVRNDLLFHHILMTAPRTGQEVYDIPIRS